MSAQRSALVLCTGLTDTSVSGSPKMITNMSVRAITGPATFAIFSLAVTLRIIRTKIKVSITSIKSAAPTLPAPACRLYQVCPLNQAERLVRKAS